MFSREGQGHGLGRYNWEYFSLRYICFALGRCPPFFVEHICAAFSGQCFVPGIDVVLFAPVCVLYLHACLHIGLSRPAPIHQRAQPTRRVSCFIILKALSFSCGTPRWGFLCAACCWWGAAATLSLVYSSYSLFYLLPGM